MRLPSLTLVFPCFNEVENVPLLVQRAVEALEEFADTGEVLIVDDGSSDGTAEAVEKAAAGEERVRVLRRTHQGYGSTVAAGLSEAASEFVFFSDGDLQFDLHELGRLIPELNGHGLVIGYREKRADGAGRSVLQRCYRAWSQLLLRVPGSVRDLNCAFKIFRRDVLTQMLPLVTVSALINAELVTKANILGAQIAQVPVSHYPRTRGQQTGGNWRVIARAVLETTRLACHLQRFRRENVTRITKL